MKIHSHVALPVFVALGVCCYGQMSEQQAAYCTLLANHVAVVKEKIKQHDTIKAPPNANPAEQQAANRQRNEINRAVIALNQAFIGKEEALLPNGAFTNWYARLTWFPNSQTMRFSFSCGNDQVGTILVQGSNRMEINGQETMHQGDWGRFTGRFARTTPGPEPGGPTSGRLVIGHGRDERDPASGSSYATVLQQVEHAPAPTNPK